MIDRQESELVLAAQIGSPDAFGRLVKKYQNMVTSLAFSKTGDLQRSEEFAQQAFMLAWENLTDLREPERFGGWLRSIATNLTLNSNRKSGRLARVAQEIEIDSEPASNEVPGDAISSKEQKELLWLTLKKIPEEYREPLVLFYREEKSVAQVAELMGLSIDSVKQRLSRGRAMLKCEVEQFVEDLLGSSKPGASFTSAVLLSLPASSAGVSKTVIQSGILLGSKTMMGNFALLAAGPIVGALGGIMGGAVGAAGAWYGTKAAEKQATSKEEVALLWRFYWIITIETVVLTIGSIVAAYNLPKGFALPLFVLGATVLFLLLLSTQIVLFVQKQRALHRIHGAPAYASQASITQPASLRENRWAIVAGSAGKDQPGVLRLGELGNIYSSPVGANGHVYVTDLDGTTMVLSHETNPKLVAVNRLNESISASAAIDGDEIFLRGDDHLFCIGSRSPPGVK